MYFGTISKIEVGLFQSLVNPSSIPIQCEPKEEVIGVCAGDIHPGLDVASPDMRCLRRLWVQPAQCQQQRGQQPGAPPLILSKR